MSHSAPLDPRVLEEAAHWLTRLCADTVTEEDRAACERWCQSSAEHARAWQRAELLMRKLGGVPPRLAMRVLDRPDRPARRRAIARIVGLLVVAPSAAWVGKRLVDDLQWTADFRSRIGERREIELGDGTEVTLNTGTAIDVSFSESARQLTLRAGEILVATAKDARANPRPFRILTAQGVLQPLGTRFNVRIADDAVRVAVFEGAVAVESKHAAFPRRVITAGTQTSFTRDGIAEPEPTHETVPAWTSGMFVADGLPLADMVREISRYHAGLVRCDPAIGSIPVSGAFPIADTRRTLGMLEATYPVRVHSATPYWITLTAR